MSGAEHRRVHRPGMSRRQALRLGGGGALAMLLNPGSAVATSEADRKSAEESPTGGSLASCEEPLFGLLRQRLRHAEAQAITRQAVLADRAAAVAHVEDLRRRGRRCLGAFTALGPLEAEAMGAFERDAYRLEKWVFASRPGFLVAANLYLPLELSAASSREKRPGVLGLCGHGAAGKAAADNQAFAQGLARRGMVVLLIDPPGQGERLLYPDPAGGSLYGAGAAEHMRAQSELLPLGESLASWMVRDAIRGLDLLAARPDVDASRLGVVGHSGGGAIAAWLAAVDPRLSFVACNCFVSGFRRNFENQQRSDSDMLPPGALALALEQADFLAAAAPRPVLILAQERDFFDVRGAEESYSRLSELYELLGAKDAVELFVGPSGHGFGLENRAALERFASRVCGLEEAADGAVGVELEKRVDLRVAPGGRVATLGSWPLSRWAAERASGLAKKRGEPRGGELRSALRRVLRLPRRSSKPPDYRILRPRRAGRYWSTPYALTIEEGFEVVAHRPSRQRHPARPPRAETSAVLVLTENAETVAGVSGRPLYASLPRAAAVAERDFVAVHALLLDEPLLGRQTFDVLRILDWIFSFGHREAQVTASGPVATLPALFAAFLEERVARIEIEAHPPAIATLVAEPTAKSELAHALPGMLEQFDLDDIYAELGSRLAVGSAATSRP